MSEQESMTLEVRLMGGLECKCGGERLEFVYNTGAKLSQMLLLLLFNAHRGTPREHVLEALYQNSDADAANSLKTLFFRLRSAFSGALELKNGAGLTLSGGVYDIAPDIAVHSDVEEFKALYAAAQQEPDQARQAQLLERACAAYGGELLPMLSTEPWVIFENAALADMFGSAVRRLCRYYKETLNYEGTYQICKRALRFTPFCEEWVIGSIDALLAQGRYNQALAEYEETTQTLFDDFGVYPSEQLLEALRRISDKLSFSISTAESVSRSLEEGPVQGAYYCTYPNFLSSYRILRRVMSRDRVTCTLLLFTVVDREGKPLENKNEIINAIAALHIALGISLRRSDMFTRFSKTQMLVMLWNMMPESSSMVIERVKNRLQSSWGTENWRLESVVLSGEEALKPAAPEGKAAQVSWRPIP